MTLRKGHGRGAGTPRVEVLPPDEQPFAPAGAAAPQIERDDGGRVRDSEAARRMARMPRRSAFLPREIAAHPKFAEHDRRRREWLRRRRDELHASTGGVSHGVGAMLSSAAWLYAGGECAAELAAETMDLDLFKVAATLTSTARQHDLAAWELAVREAKARVEATPATDVPWMKGDDR